MGLNARYSDWLRPIKIPMGIAISEARQNPHNTVIKLVSILSKKVGCPENLRTLISAVGSCASASALRVV